MKKEEVGAQVLDLISQVTGESLESTIDSMVEKKLENVSFNSEVTHTIKVGDYEPKKIKGSVCQEFDKCLAYVANLVKKNLWLTGSAGTGKGTISRQIAEAFEADFYEVNAVQDKFELTGFVDANSYYVETQFYNACKNASEGNPTVFMFDEVDCSIPEVLKIFNEAVASREFTFPNGETLEFPNLIIICASNSYGTGADMQYCGNRLDASFHNRFAKVEIKFDPKVELAVAGGDKELVEFIHEVRKAGETMRFVPSYRDIERIACMKGALDMRDVLRECLIMGLISDDDVDIIKNHLTNRIPNNPYTMAFKGLFVDFSKKAVKTA